MPVRPPPLEAGSQIRVLSPSGPITDELIGPGLDVLRSWELRVSVDDRAFDRARYLAGSDEARAAALNEAIEDPDVDGIVFSRGGYGAMRILDSIDWSSLAGAPKLICGYSDITAIHFAALRHADLVTIHGPVLKSFPSQTRDLAHLRRILFGAPIVEPFEIDVLRRSEAPVRGRAIGGNLSLVCALLASSHVPDLAGAVLFLEDVGEEDYRLDRLFTVLRLAPALSELAAVVLGEFSECGGTYVGTEEIPTFVRELGREFGDALDIPVVAGFPIGHEARNAAFLHGAPATVDTREAVVRLDTGLSDE